MLSGKFRVVLANPPSTPAPSLNIPSSAKLNTSIPDLKTPVPSVITTPSPSTRIYTMPPASQITRVTSVLVITPIPSIIKPKF